MVARGKLDDLLAGEGTKPVIRRGQGVHLSTDESPPVVLGAQDPSISETHPVTAKRINRGYMLREDLILGCKRLALRDGRKLYEVMEDALSEYLSRHEQTDPIP